MDFETLNSVANDLTQKIKYRKHIFRRIWITKLIEFYRTIKMKKLIHLSDIEENLFLKFDNNGTCLLKTKLNLIKKKTKHFYLVKKAIENGTFVSLETLKGLYNGINIFEPHIKELKTTKSGYGRIIKNPKFPLNLNTEFGAVLLGNYPDATIGRGDFGTNNKESLLELDKLFNIHIGKIKSNIWKDKSGYKMQISSIIKILYKYSGLKNTGRQIANNNAIPFWIFNSSKNFQRLFLKKVWDCEGSAPNTKKMCLGQSLIVNDVHENIPYYPKRRLFTSIENKEKILDQPPNLLVSLQLLMYMFRIESYMKPHRLYKKKTGQIVCDWHLLITKYPNIKNFYEEIGFGITEKQNKLKKCLESYTRNYPQDKTLRESDILKFVKDKESFTIKDLSGKFSLTDRSIANYLIQLKNKNKIKKIRTIGQGKSSYLNLYKTT